MSSDGTPHDINHPIIIDFAICGECEAEIIRRAHIDFVLRYCPYCGVKFNSRTENGGPPIPIKDTDNPQ